MTDEEIEDYLEKIKDKEIEVYLRKIKDILTELRGGASCASGPCQLSDHVYIGKVTVNHRLFVSENTVSM